MKQLPSEICYTHVSYLDYSFTLILEAIFSSETSILFEHPISETITFHNHTIMLKDSL
jgi:hypothetical protein